MTLLVNKKNNKIVKEVEDENLASIYLGTNEWKIFEKVEPKPRYESTVNVSPVVEEESTVEEKPTTNTKFKKR